MSLVEDLLSICDEYMYAAWYVGEAIPEKKLNRAIAEYPIPPEDKVIALLDCTVFGSGKYGMAVCESGLYVNHDWSATVRKGYLTWDEFVHTDIVAHGKWEVDVASNFVVNFAASDIKQDQLITLLKHIQTYFAERLTQSVEGLGKNHAKEPSSEQWMLAIEGELFGPYSTGIVKEMIRSGQIKVDTTYGWKQGMEQWRFLESLPEFGQQTSATLTPPPLPEMTPTRNVNFAQQLEKVLELNTATVEDLLSLPGVDLNLAEKVIEERTNKNGFTNYHEIRKIMNLQPHQFEHIRKTTTLQPLRSNPIGMGRVIDY